MRIVRFHKDSTAPNSDAAIVVLRGIVDQPFGNGARMMPQSSSGLRIERVRIVGGSDQHDAVDNDRRDLEVAGVRRMKDPLDAEICHVAGINFAEATVPATGVVAIVGKPIGSDRSG